jgi:hypothetical protein
VVLEEKGEVAYPTVDFQEAKAYVEEVDKASGKHQELIGEGGLHI